jgi:membrane protein DedA with SNARE-associated domain
VPADTAVALGAFLSARGAPISPWAVYGVTVVANVTSAVGMYFVSRTVGKPFLESRTGRRLLSERAQQRILKAYQDHHLWGIFVSRFLPGYRAVVPPFAAALGLPASKALPPVVLASAVYYGLLVALVYRLGANWETVTRLVRGIGWWLGGIAALVTAAIVWALVKRRHAAAAGP